MSSLNVKKDRLCHTMPRAYYKSLELSVEGLGTVLIVESVKYQKALWQFCTYVFVPQCKPKDYHDQ